MRKAEAALSLLQSASPRGCKCWKIKHTQQALGCAATGLTSTRHETHAAESRGGSCALARGGRAAQLNRQVQLAPEDNFQSPPFAGGRHALHVLWRAPAARAGKARPQLLDGAPEYNRAQPDNADQHRDAQLKPMCAKASTLWTQKPMRGWAGTSGRLVTQRACSSKVARRPQHGLDLTRARSYLSHFVLVVGAAHARPPASHPFSRSATSTCPTS